MQITKTELKSMIEEVVSPLIADGVSGAAEGLVKEVEEKISEATSKLTLARPKIELGEENLLKDPKGGFESVSHFARDIYKATKAQFRNMSLQLQAWSKAADTTTLRTDDSEYGGFLIPDEYRNELWLAVEQKNPLWPLVTHVPMATNTVKIPYVNGFDESGGLVYGGVQWLWLDELASKTASRPKLGLITLSLSKLAGLAYASDEILEDSPQSMENILKKGFSDGLTFQLMKMLVRGTGAGQPMGVLNAPCLVSITKETGQSAATIVWENIIKMYARSSNAGNSVFVANESTLPQLASMALSVGTGGVPVYMPANGAAGVPYDTLLGRPLIFNKHCSTVGSVGDIILADWSQYLVGMKAGQGPAGKFDSSIHLKFDADQTAFRFVIRIAGQPWWSTYLTPPQATTQTISPFVVIQTRS